MDEFRIEGRNPLNGEVTPSGNKNAALPMIAASLLTEEPVVLGNVPHINDVQVMCDLVEQLGVRVERTVNGKLTLQARDVHPAPFDSQHFRRIRGSILLAGPMLSRLGQTTFPRPGGDLIGRRRVDTHFLALTALGATHRVNENFYLQAGALHGADILLDQASVTGTENAVMAAVRAKGTTVLRNAASEPHVQELCHCLCQMGARIDGIGSNTLTIEGVDRLGGTTFNIGPDYLEVGSLIGLGAVTQGEILIRNAAPHYLRMTCLIMERLGVCVEIRGEDIFVPEAQPMEIVPDIGGAIPEIADMPWPAFPPDMMSMALVVATQAAGTVLFHEKMFESRLYFVDKLIGMGARIILCDPHRAVVQGPSPLKGDELTSPDIRAGMALLIAALCADGQSTIRNIGQIDRGYERIDAKLRALGAHIERVQGNPGLDG